MRFPIHSVCFLQIFFFRSEQKFLPVLYHCAKFYKFSPSTFRDIFRSKYKFCKIFEYTRSLDLHLREPGVLARARAISGPGRARAKKLFQATLNLDSTKTKNLRSETSAFKTKLVGLSQPEQWYRSHRTWFQRTYPWTNSIQVFIIQLQKLCIIIVSMFIALC